MLDPADINHMEQQLKERGIPVAELCRRAKIAETTWGRWKAQAFHPSYRKAQAVKAAFADLVPPSEAAE